MSSLVSPFIANRSPQSQNVLDLLSVSTTVAVVSFRHHMCFCRSNFGSKWAYGDTGEIPVKGDVLAFFHALTAAVDFLSRSKELAAKTCHGSPSLSS